LGNDLQEKEAKEMTLIGINTKKIGEDLSIGVGLAVVFIVLNMLSPIASIGIPRLPMAAEWEQFGTVVLLAPLAEEVIFRCVALAVFILIFMAIVKDKWIAMALAIVVVSVIFSVFHYTAYGGSFTSMSAAFVGAFSFSVLACIIALWRKSLVSPIILHSLFNTYLYISLYKLLTIG